MKCIVTKPEAEIDIDKLRGDELIGYFSSGGHLCVLKRICPMAELNVGAMLWGFVNLAYSASDITYSAPNSLESISIASKGGKQLFVFDSYKEMIDVVHKFVRTNGQM